jgi:hypothetical protein
MGKIRRWIILLVASTVLFVSLFLEILAPLPGLESHPGVYFLIILAVLGEFLLPRRILTPLYYSLISAGILVAAVYYLLPTASHAGNLNTSLFSLLIEMGFSAWLVYAAHTISSALRPLEAREEVLRVIGVDDPSLDIQTSRPRIHAEITRSRHYDRPLMVVALHSADLLVPGALEEQGGSFSNWVAGEYTRARFARTIKSQLRAMDLVLKDPDNHFIVLVCPEIGAGELHEVSRHLENVVHREFGIQPLMASASFPEDGISFEGLYQKAAEDLTQKVEEARKNAAKPKMGLTEKVYANE